MKGKTSTALLILTSILLIKAEPSTPWIDIAFAALAGLAMLIAVRIIFRAIDRAGRK